MRRGGWRGSEGTLCGLRNTPSSSTPTEGALILTTLRYPNEVIDPGTVKDIKELKQPSNKELELADKILDNLTGEFDIHEYKDTYRENVEKLIKKKLKGETIKVEKPEKKEEVKELMVALEQTLQQMKKG